MIDPRAIEDNHLTPMRWDVVIDGNITRSWFSDSSAVNLVIYLYEAIAFATSLYPLRVTYQSYIEKNKNTFKYYLSQFR